MSISTEFSSFIAFDLETTGLDAKINEIIEIGAIKVQRGKIIDRFTNLVKPKIPIPPAITQITGIANDDVADAPHIEEILPLFIEFIGDYPLVAHNIQFDISFIKYNAQKILGIDIKNELWDTLELARILFPTLYSHKLESVAEFFGFELKNAHRALADTEAVAHTILALIDHLENTDYELIADIKRLTANTDWKMKNLFKRLDEKYTKDILPKEINDYKTKSELLKTEVNIRGSVRDWKRPIEIPTKNESQECTTSKEYPINVDEVVRMFDKDGLLSKRLSEYEYRPQQMEMVKGVALAFNQNEFLVVEAGTGTGKSLAYLIPAIQWSIQNKSRIVVSTNTKNLQEQLFNKDIPLLQSALSMQFRAVLLKGRNNYLCNARWLSALQDPESYLTPNERIEALPLLRWAKETQTGDISENNGFNINNKWNVSLWNKLNAEGSACTGRKCPFYDKCYAISIRQSALESHLTIVNHSLLFSDLATDNAILSDYERLIFDEAHNIEEVATNYLGKEINQWSIKGLIKRLYQKDTTESGLLVIIRQKLEFALNKKKKLLDDKKQMEITDAIDFLDNVIDEVDRINYEIDSFFKSLTESAYKIITEKQKQENGESIELSETIDDSIINDIANNNKPQTSNVKLQNVKLRYRKDDKFTQLIIQSVSRLYEELTQFKENLLSINRRLKGLTSSSQMELFDEQDKLELNQELLARIDEISVLLDNLNELAQAENEEYVYWVETPYKVDLYDTKMYSAPISISDKLNELLYDKMKTIIFTSATLAIGNNFDFLIERLGLGQNSSVRNRLVLLNVGSPFHYDRQTYVGVPNFLPSPKSQKEFNKAIIPLLSKIISTTRRGTLVLFTSYSLLNSAYKQLKESLPTGTLVLAQGIDGSRTNILNLFKANKKAVLLGTDSFWEGIDVPGEAMEMLIITKLPFDVPSEPIIEAQMEEVKKAGKDPFRDYSVPRAIIKLRQGFGRLIRTKTDRGIIIILDNRILNTYYGQKFTESLPTRCHTLKSWEEMEKKLKGFSF